LRFPFVGSLAVVVTLVVVAVSPLGAEPPSNVRTEDPQFRRLIDAGLANSPSLRALVERLEESDVIVYVSCDFLNQALDGRLTFNTVAGNKRYLHVRIGWHLSDLRKLSTLGHELQHAVEIAQDPEIVDSQSLGSAYSHMGVTRRKSATHQAYDTPAAIEAGDCVWQELAGIPSDQY
jgi:hypothetical protein